MTSVFSRIIAGDLPGTFVWRDPVAVAFLSIDPIAPGHTLVVPIVEVDHWIDLDLATASHLLAVSQSIGRAQQRAFHPRRVGLVIAGYEVRHVHLHVIPTMSMADLDFARARRAARSDLEAVAARLRDELVALDHADHIASA